jgi:hypothetical protein
MTPETTRVAHINNKAINTAVEILKQCGWDYTLRSPDGQLLTNTKAKVRRPKKYSFAHLGIAEKLNNAIPGQQIVFAAGDIPLKNLGSRITGEACRIFGKGGYTTTASVDRNTITIRVGVPSKVLAAELQKSINSIQQLQGSTQLRLNS